MGASPDVTRRWALSANGIAMQWAGVLAGPIAWALDLVVSYSRVKEACGTPRMIWLHLMTVLALAIIGGGAWSAWQVYSATPESAPTDGGTAIDRTRFMAILGLSACAFFTLGVIALAIPRWVQASVCQ